jgi:hypothetical protein
MKKILICGTRVLPNRSYAVAVVNELDFRVAAGCTIIHGACPNSADEYADTWAKANNIPVQAFPGRTGNYLARNIEMVAQADELIAFFDGFSYGTSHTIAHAVKKGIPIKIISVKK